MRIPLSTWFFIFWQQQHFFESELAQFPIQIQHQLFVIQTTGSLIPSCTPTTTSFRRMLECNFHRACCCASSSLNFYLHIKKIQISKYYKNCGRSDSWKTVYCIVFSNVTREGLVWRYYSWTYFRLIKTHYLCFWLRHPI